MKLFKFERVRNRLFINFFGIKFKYTSFNNWGKCNKLSDSHIIKLVKEISHQEIENVKKGTIFVIGDSHSVFFSGQDFLSYKKLKCGITTGCQSMPTFKNYHLGAVLAYNAMKENSTTNTLNKTKFLLEKGYIKKGDRVVLSFGEIDIRVHLFKRVQKDENGEYNIQSMNNEIDLILNKYLEYIKMLQNEGLKVIIWGAVASQNDSVPKDFLLPSIGSEQNRNLATKIFNENLEKLSKENGFIFCSIFNKLVDDKLNTKTQYYVDGYHLGTKALPLMIEEFLNKKVLIIKDKEVLINPEFQP